MEERSEIPASLLDNYTKHLQDVMSVKAGDTSFRGCTYFSFPPTEEYHVYLIFPWGGVLIFSHDYKYIRLDFIYFFFKKNVYSQNNAFQFQLPDGTEKSALERSPTARRGLRNSWLL